ncbi:MAG: magnesium transporter, partial [Thermoproteota archaeon]|nr:magnesium transporter [Thermoproteota archaeon]
MRSTLPLLVVMAAIGTLSGVVLQEFEDELLKFPSTLILVPALIGVGGNLGAILSSRLSTAVHLGILELNMSNIVFKNNVLAVVIASVFIFLILGLSAFAFGALFGVASVSL